LAIFFLFLKKEKILFKSTLDLIVKIPQFCHKKDMKFKEGGGGREKTKKKKKQRQSALNNHVPQSNLDWQHANSCSGMTTEQQNDERESK